MNDSPRPDLAAKAAQRAAAPAILREGMGVFWLEVDGKPLRTPAGLELRLPTRRLAEAILAELGATPAQALKNASAIPNLRFAATALDRVAAARAETVETIAAYGGTDLLCYRAEEPEELVRRQAASWQPLLDWAATRYGARLESTSGIIHRAQSPEALAKLRAAVAALDDLALTGTAMAVQISGSLVLGLALLEGRIDAAEAFELAELDETFQIEKWGEDDEAADRRAARRKDLAETESYLKLLRS